MTKWVFPGKGWSAFVLIWFWLSWSRISDTSGKCEDRETEKLLKPSGWGRRWEDGPGPGLGHMARARAMAAPARALRIADWLLSFLISWLFWKRPSWLLPVPPSTNRRAPEAKEHKVTELLPVCTRTWGQLSRDLQIPYVSWQSPLIRSHLCLTGFGITVNLGHCLAPKLPLKRLSGCQATLRREAGCHGSALFHPACADWEKTGQMSKHLNHY